VRRPTAPIRRRALFALGIGLVLSIGRAIACAPGHHTVDPYRTDATAAARLEARAQSACAERRPPGAPPPERAFVSDGCSAWIDGDRYVGCCVEHDIAYWCGGSAAERRAADDAFGRCVSSSASGSLGWLLRSSVRIGGHPVMPFYWRWGYGDDYLGGYPEAGEPAALEDDRDAGTE